MAPWSPAACWWPVRDEALTAQHHRQEQRRHAWRRAGLNLPQGGTCQWDDKSDSSGIMGVNNVIGNGLIAGSPITSNNKVQVTLLTGDVCVHDALPIPAAHDRGATSTMRR